MYNFNVVETDFREDLFMSDYTPLAKPWSAMDLFSTVNAEDIRVDEVKKNEYRPFIMADLCVESDASNLYRELVEHHTLSKEFRQFLEPWHQEEINHATGFCRIMNLLFGMDDAQLIREVTLRKADFSRLESVLDDEFKLAIMLAYDECASTMSYKQDTFYQSLGPVEFNQWITLVIKDEARHFMNAVKLIHCKHRGRLHETQRVLDDILAMDSANHPYQATFLLHNDADYAQNPESSTQLREACAARVFTVITRGN